MKKVLLPLLFWVLFSFSYAQTYYPLVENNKNWTTAHTYGNPFVVYSDAIKFEGDTTINGSIYKSIWRSTDNAQLNWVRYGFIREFNKQVYWLTWSGGPTNNLIYDFGANEGDTIYLLADPMGFYFSVDSIGETILLTGEVRRTIHVTGHDAGGSTFGTDTWVEGMGSMYGVLQSAPGVLIGDNPQLICFTQNDTLKYHNSNFELCYVTTGLDQKEKLESITISQDPQSGRLTVQAEPDLLPLNLEVFDLTGNRVVTKCLVQSYEKINSQRLGNCGLYLFRFRNEEGSVLMTKKVFLH